MNTLKLADDELHRRFKTCCAAARKSMLEAVDQMVREYCEDVERRTPGLLATGPAIEIRATRRKPGKPSHRQQLAASGQQEIPNDGQKQEGSTKRGRGGQEMTAPPRHRGERP